MLSLPTQILKCVSDATRIRNRSRVFICKIPSTQKPTSVIEVASQFPESGLPLKARRRCWVRGAVIHDHDIVFKSLHRGVLDRQVDALVYEFDERPPSHRKGFLLIGPGPKRRRPASKLGREFRRGSIGYPSQIGPAHLAEERGVEVSFDRRKPKLTGYINVLRLLSCPHRHSSTKGPDIKTVFDRELPHRHVHQTVLCVSVLSPIIVGDDTLN